MFFVCFLMWLYSLILFSYLFVLFMAFKFGAWNVRGLNDPYKQKSVLDILRKENLRFFGLLETKIKIDNFVDTFEKFLPNWDKISNHNWAENDRIL